MSSFSWQAGGLQNEFDATLSATNKSLKHLHGIIYDRSVKWLLWLPQLLCGSGRHIPAGICPCMNFPSKPFETYCTQWEWKWLTCPLLWCVSFPDFNAQPHASQIQKSLLNSLSSSLVLFTFSVLQYSASTSEWIGRETLIPKSLLAEMVAF